MRCVRSDPSSSLSPSCYLLSPRSLASSCTSLFPAPCAGANPLICAKQQFSAWHSSWFEICIPPTRKPYQQQVSGEAGTIYLR